MNETVTVTLTEFLLERIAEDEESLPCENCGRPVEPDGPREDGDFGHVAAALRADDPEAQEFWADPCPSPEPTRRALAECEAKRRIVEECQRILGVKWWEYEDAPGLADSVLSSLALPYAGHPDYRDEWRP